MAEQQTPLDWLTSDQKADPGADDTESVDDKVEGAAEGDESPESVPPQPRDGLTNEQNAGAVNDLDDALQQSDSAGEGAEALGDAAPADDPESFVGPGTLDWLIGDGKINPGAFDTDSLDEEIRGRYEAGEGAENLKWLNDGDLDAALVDDPESLVTPPSKDGILDITGRVASDIKRGLAPIKASIQVVGGVRDGLQEMIDAAVELDVWLDENAFDDGFFGPTITKEGKFDPRAYRFPLYPLVGYYPPGALTSEEKLGEKRPTLPTVEEPDTVTGQAVRSVAQFLTGFIPAGRVLKGINATTKIAKIGKVMLQGGIADVIAFDGHEKRLANLLEDVAEIKHPVIDFLKADENDSEALGRLKNAIEGAALGVVGDGLIHALRFIKAARKARKAAAEAKGETIDTVLEKDANATLRGITDQYLLGDETAPLFAIVGKRRPGRADDVAERGLYKAGEFGYKEIYVNFARIKSPDDIKALVDQLGQTFIVNSDKARRGIRLKEKSFWLADAEEAWSSLMDRRMGGALKDEQALAFQQLWGAAAKRLTEVADIFVKDPTPQKAYQFRRMMALTQAIQKEALGAGAETAKSLQQWANPVGGEITKFKSVVDAIEQTGGIEVSVELAKRMVKAAETDAPMRAIMKMTEKGVMARTLDAVHEYWINAALAGTKPHIGKTISRTTVIAMSLFERAYAARYAKLMGEEGVEIGEALAQLGALTDGFGDALRNAAKTFRTGQIGFGVKKIEPSRAHSISSTAFNVSSESWAGSAVDTLGSAVNVSGRVSQTVDEFFRTIGYRMELRGLAFRMAQQEVRAGKLANNPKAIEEWMVDIIDNPPESLHLAAASEAAYRTFSNSSAWQKGLKRLEKQVPGLRWVLPIIGTSGNVVRYSFERTPLAPLLSSYRTAIAKGGADAQIAKARMALGTLTMLTAAEWAADDRLTGSGPPEGPERDRWLRHHQPYSIRVGDRWIAYDQLGSIGYLLRMSADITDFARNADLDDETFARLQEASAAATLVVADRMSGKSDLQNFALLTEAMTLDDDEAAAYFEKFLSSFVPAGVSEIARDLDPVQRVPHDILGILKENTPFWSKSLAPRRDLWGRVVTYQSGLGEAYDMLSPIRASTIKPEPIDLEMEKQGFFIETPEKSLTVAGETVGLQNEPHAYSRYLELQGSTRPSAMGEAGLALAERFGERSLLETLNDVVTGKDELSQGYQAIAEPEEKLDYLLSRVVRHYRAAASDRLVEEFPQLGRRAVGKKANRLKAVAH